MPHRLRARGGSLQPNPFMRHSLFLLPLLGTAALAQSVPELEPNNTVGQAQPVIAGQHVAANLVAGEADWFSFVLPADGQVQLRTSGNYAVNPSVDTYVAVYDAAGVQRLAWDDNSDGTHSACGVTLPAGSYTVLVTGKTGSVAGDYGFDFVVLPAVAIGTVEAAEPNDNPSLGGTPTPLVLGNTFAGEVTTTTDADWYSFTLTTRSIVQAVCMDDAGFPQLDQTRLAFFQETSPGVWAALGTTSSIATSHRAFNLAHPGMLAPGNYAIEVSSATSTLAGTAPWNYVKTGKYAVRTCVMAMPGFGTTLETPEPNNNAAAAPLFALGDDAAGNISGANEGDWYGFFLTAATTVGAMCETGPAPGCTGTSLRIYDSNGTIVANGSGGSANAHARLITTLREPGFYYLEVYGAVFAGAGNYLLHTGACEPMFVASSFTTQPPSTNACPGSSGARPNLATPQGEKPFLGSTFVSRVSNVVPNTLIVPMFGLSNVSAASGTVPLPVDLTPIGAPGCFLRVDPLVLQTAVADGAGVASFALAIPPLVSARGFSIFTQCLCLDIPLNTLGMSVSNDVRLILGDRSF